MPHDHSSRCPTHQPLSVIVLAWPIGLLLLEATALTPFVEFSRGGMALLASPHILTAGIVALAAFFLIIEATERPHWQPAADSTSGGGLLGKSLFRPWAGVRRNWLVAHLVILAIFVWLTLTLHARASTVGVSWPLSVVWLLIGSAVALSILVAFVPLPGLLSIARKYIWQTGVSASIGMGLILMTPAVRDYWPDVDGPALEGLNVLLNIYPGEALLSQSSNRWPIIGTTRMTLLVTPACSELDSLLVFILLSGTLWAAMGSRLSLWKFLLLLLAGLAGLYAMLSIRLYFMVLIGMWAKDPYVAVKFAHSRISTLALLVYTLGILYLSGRLARPTPRTDSIESVPTVEEVETERAKELEVALDS